MSSSSSPAATLALFLAIIVAAVLVRKGRRDPAAASLEKRQRIRPLALEWLDPVIATLFVGPLLVHELSVATIHVLAALLGIAIGIPIGLIRARIMFVRSLTATKSVVLTRSGPEYLLVGLLLVLRSTETAIRQIHSGPFTFLLTVLLSLAIGESVTRSAQITRHYLADAATGETTA